MRTIGGLFLAVVSLTVAWIFYSNIQQEYLFKKDGEKAKATVTGVSMAFVHSFSNWGHISRSGLYQTGIGYNYIANGKEYGGRTILPYNVRSHKGDTITIEYLKNDPSISRYSGAVTDIGSLQTLLGMSIGLAITGFIIAIWPAKKLTIEDQAQEPDWEEYERTH